MAKYVIDENTLKGIGDAIRAKKGTSDPIPVPNLASEISSIVTKTYNGTIWKFRDNITFDEILAFADEYWQEEFGEYNFSFHTPFTTDVLLEDVDGEYSTQFSSIAMYGDSNYIIVEMYPVNGAATDLAYYDTNSGGEWKNHFTMTLDAEPSVEDLVFLQTFADMIGSADKPDAPTYNGYIPKGTYTIDLSRTDLVYLLLNKCEAGEDIPIFSYNEYTQGIFICVWAGYNTFPSVLLELVFRELDDGSIYFEERRGTVTIEITEEVPVEEGTFNAFMHNFTLLSYILPLGTRYYYWGEGSYDEFSIEEEEPFFVCNGNNGVGIRNYSDDNDMGISTELIFDDGTTIKNEDVEIKITREVIVPYAIYNEFIGTFYDEPLW